LCQHHRYQKPEKQKVSVRPSIVGNVYTSIALVSGVSEIMLVHGDFDISINQQAIELGQDEQQAVNQAIILEHSVPVEHIGELYSLIWELGMKLKDIYPVIGSAIMAIQLYIAIITRWPSVSNSNNA
jgi:hypothetical protein